MARETDNSELARAMSVKTNDQLMAIYLSSLIRAITAFHDLIENKIQNRQQQEEKDATGQEKEKEKVEAKDGKKEEGDRKMNGESKGEGEKKEGDDKGKDKKKG